MHDIIFSMIFFGRFASSLSKYLVWEKHLLPADHHAGWPLCKLWEHRFSVPDLVSSPPSTLFRTLHSLENTLTSNFDQNNFWSLTVARNCNAVTAKKAAIASFIWTTFRGHFRLGANDITRNRSRVIFSRVCVDIYRRWISIIAHFTVTGENEAGFDLVLIQPTFRA